MGRQLIFIDDSGDPGFKFRHGASRMFVIACVIFDDVVDAEYARAAIKRLKKQLGWRQEREFKFHKSSEEHKRAFFKLIKKLDFRIRAIYVDKTKVIEPKLKKGDSFYQEIILEVLDRFAEMSDAYVKLDGKGGKNYRNRSATKVRRKLNKNNYRVAYFGFEDSKNEPLIQLADMVAGAVRTKYDPDKKARHDFFKYLSYHVEDMHEYTG